MNKAQIVHEKEAKEGMDQYWMLREKELQIKHITES